MDDGSSDVDFGSVEASGTLDVGESTGSIIGGFFCNRDGFMSR